MAFAGLIPDYTCVIGDNDTGAENVCSINGTHCQAFTYLGDANTVISEVMLIILFIRKIYDMQITCIN